ncbi:hypothetical protein PS903_05134 [Pseudomonas fluorescens]|nr:hypothetical protein PS903_05134 [Pseudomonas fluorescens]
MKMGDLKGSPILMTATGRGGVSYWLSALNTLCATFTRSAFG